MVYKFINYIKNLKSWNIFGVPKDVFVNLNGDKLFYINIEYTNL